MDKPAVSSGPAAGALAQIAHSMQTAARRTPDTAIYPPKPLRSGAQLMLKLHTARNVLHLRIARRGLSPLNHYNADGEKRLRAWRNEIKTFRREFGIPAEADTLDRGALVFDGAQELLYYVDIFWSASSAPAVAH